MKITCDVKSCDRNGKCVTACLCADCVAIPIHPNSQSKRGTNMLSETEKAVCRMTGVSEEQYVNAKAKRIATHTSSRYPDADKNFEPQEAADDDGYPSESDMSAGAHIARAKNHLEAMDNEDDEISPDERLDKAIDCLLRAKQQRASAPGALGQHRVRFVG
jgi:hypothetical protein